MTTYVAWEPGLTVFVDEIDDQHKQLYMHMNAFLESVVRGKGDREVAEILKFLIDYCVVHFRTEEQFMQEHKYPAYAVHKKAHEDLTAGVLDIQKEVRQGLTSQHIVAIINQLGGWVTEHIQKMDKALGAYLSSVLGKSRSKSSLSIRGVGIPGPRIARAEESAGRGTRICSHVHECAIMFDRFLDPECKSFWKTRYCLTRGGLDCQRRGKIDGGTDPSQIPITMLPNGENFRFLGE